MARRGNACGICESANHPSACTNCVNFRLNEKYKTLKRLFQQRDSLRRRLDAQLIAKREADLQRHWRAEHAERKAKLREQLRLSSNGLMEAKARGEEQQDELDGQTTALASASSELAMRQIEQLGQYYPDLIRAHTLGYATVSAELSQKRRLILRQLCKILSLRRGTSTPDDREGSGHVQPVRICGVVLPVGDDPTSVPPLELAASLGYMVQLVNLTARYLSAPILHSAGFAASSSRVWQRASYWDTRPASRGDEYPLFLPRENGSVVEETRELGQSSSSSHSNLGLSSMEGSRGSGLENSEGSLVRSSSSPTSSRETHRDVQKGIKLLKRSVACINAYGYRVLSLQVPQDMSTFEAFTELLSALVSKEPRTRSSRGSQQPNGRFGLSEGHIPRLGSCPPSMLEEVKPPSDILGPKTSLKGKVNSWNDFLDIGDDSDHSDGKDSESLFDGWDLVEHPTLPPPPSHSEDVEHWTRAMFIDATK